MKKILILLSIIFLLSGCYDYTEIDDISIVSGIILDYMDNKYELTIELLNNEKESKTVVYKTSCKEIETCILEISNESNKEIFISHQKALILTDRTVNKDVDFYDYFLRNSKSKMNYYVYYISDEYKDLLFKDNKDNVSFYLKDIIDYNTKDYSSLIKLSFIDMIQKISEKGIINIYPNIIVKDDKVIIDSLIAFNDTNKVILNNNESIFYNIISNNTNLTSINVPCEKGSFSLNINRSKSNYEYNNNLEINIKEKAKLSNYNCNYDLNDDKTINKLENLANNYLKEQTNNIIKLSQNNNIDFLGLERYIYKHNKKEIDLSKIKVEINTNIRITSIGESR